MQLCVLGCWVWFILWNKSQQWPPSFPFLQAVLKCYYSLLYHYVTFPIPIQLSGLTARMGEASPHSPACICMSRPTSWVPHRDLYGGPHAQGSQVVQVTVHSYESHMSKYNQWHDLAIQISIHKMKDRITFCCSKLLCLLIGGWSLVIRLVILQLSGWRVFMGSAWILSLLLSYKKRVSVLWKLLELTRQHKGHQCGLGKRGHWNKLWPVQGGVPIQLSLWRVGQGHCCSHTTKTLVLLLLVRTWGCFPYLPSRSFFT